MKYLIQILIIMGFSLLGEVLNILIPLPIPGSIYGMMLLLIALMTGLVKVASVKETGEFLIDILPLLFIPPAVGLIDSWIVMQDFLVAIIVISIVSTFAVAAVTGRVTQYIMSRKSKGQE